MKAAEAKKGRACVILGAGASYDVAGLGSAIQRPELRPPLAKELFSIRGRKEFADVLGKYPGADLLTQRLAARITNDELSVENSLREYAYHQDPLIQEHFKHVPAYLRDLLYLTGNQYAHAPSSHDQLVIELLAEVPNDVLFIVLNYDNLLERAISRYNSYWSFSTLPDYVAEDRSGKVVKLHGFLERPSA